MLRNESMTVPEGNDPIPQVAYVMPGGPTLEDFQRVMLEVWDEVREENGFKKPEKSKEMRAMDQRLASLEQDARQPCLAMEADGPADAKTRERTEGAATAVQPMRGDSFEPGRSRPEKFCQFW